MTKYIVVRPDEDGNTVRFVDESELEKILANPLDYGISRFVDWNFIAGEKNPQYWGDCAAIFEVNLIKPVQKTTAWKLP